MSPILEITLLTLKVAVVATIGIAPVATVVGWLLARYRGRGKTVVETVILMPMVVPPVATGLVLLTILSSSGPLHHFWQLLGNPPILLTWYAAALAAAIIAFPLFARAAQQAFAEVPEQLEQLSLTFNKTRWQTFLLISLPLAKRGLLSGGLLAFARALGEFGATSLVAGSIPGETETLALGIYSGVVNGDDAHAWQLAIVSIAIAFVAVLTAKWVERQ